MANPNDQELVNLKLVYVWITFGLRLDLDLVT